jgi:hypothetical protein
MSAIADVSIPAHANRPLKRTDRLEASICMVNQGTPCSVVSIRAIPSPSSRPQQGPIRYGSLECALASMGTANLLNVLIGI